MIAVLGESLVDLVRVSPDASTYRAMVGGSPYNVARAAARQGVDTRLFTQIGDDAFGRQLLDTAVRDGVDVTAVVRGSGRTGFSITGVDAAGSPDYEFRLEDDGWAGHDLSGVADASIVHFGSIASWHRPMDEQIGAAVRRAGGLVTYDPNVRPLLLDRGVDAVEVIERSVSVSDLVKASDEDLAVLYPGAAVVAVADRWLRLGVQLLVVTAGERGVSAYRAGSPPMHRPAVEVAVVDTVGAGDCAMATLLAGLVARGVTCRAALAALDGAELESMLDDAVLAAAVTCARRGAEPPTADELSNARSIVEAAG